MTGTERARRARRPSRAPATAVLTAAFVLTVLACGAPGPTVRDPVRTIPVLEPPPAASIEPAGSPAGASTSPAAAGPTDISVDPSLLALLPADIGGVALTPDPETAAEVAAAPSLGPSLSAIAVAAAFGPPASDAIGDYVVATVARLRPEVFDEAWFRDWRDSFDAGVCEQAGGVSGHAETTLAGHQTFIGSCTGGVHTYHVYLPRQDVVVSLQGIGPGRFGERVIEGLTE